MSLIGNVLGNRYRVVSKLGGGGMAVVYRCEDLYLDRQVAVKVLRPQLSADEEFLRRFRREAHSAARLAHPNLVSIYDVGQEGDHYYIVLELIEGSTLKDKIVKEGPLDVSEAAALSLDILAALIHAHSHSIIHRDIKPHNILISEDGRLRVTDFGLARVSTTDTVTNSGSMMGTAHYLAPEVARNQPATERSDVYSLGCVLYEMVTAQVPFRGDSPISIALQHIQEEPVPPSSFNPAVPAELEAIIARAMAKDPGQRYASAEDMRIDLVQFQQDHARGRTSAPVGDSPTQDLRALRGRKAAMAARKPDPRPPGSQRGVRWGLWVLLILFLLVVGGGAWAAWQFQKMMDVPTVQVPDVVGQPLAAAQVMLEQNGLLAKVVGEGEFSELPPNYVVAINDLRAGDEVRRGRVVELRLSKGRKTVSVPRVAGLPRVEAEDAILRAGLKVGNVFQAFDRTVAEGRVIRQTPPEGTPAREEQAVDLWVSRGALLVPNLSGKTLEEARHELTSLQLLVGEIDRIPSVRPKDTVVAQYPVANDEVTPETRINLSLSQGQEMKVNEAVKQIQVRGPKGTVQVQVLLSDAAAQNTLVYNELRQSGETFDLRVRWIGPTGKLTVLVQGSFSYEVQLP